MWMICKTLLFILLCSGSLKTLAHTDCEGTFLNQLGPVLKTYWKSILLKPAKKMKLQTEHYLKLDNKTHKGMRLTGNEAYDLFRIGFNNGVTINDGQFISYITQKGTLVNGKIIKIEKNKVTIVDEYNNLTTLQQEDLNTIKVSSISKQIFSKMDQSLFNQKITHFTVPSTGAFYKKQGGIQYGIIKDLRDSRVTIFSVPNMKNKKEEPIDLDISELIKPLKKGDTISLINESLEQHINARIISEISDYKIHTPIRFRVAFVKNGVLHINEVNNSEIRPPILYTKNEVINIQMPPKRENEDYYFLRLAYPIKGNKKWNNWAIEPTSPLLRKWIYKSVQIIKQKTGIQPIHKMELSETDKNRVYEVWLNDIVTQMASPNRRDYIISKAWILKNSQERGLGYILNEGIAMDFELSLFGVILLHEYGFRVRIGTGNLKDKPDISNPHTWIQVLDLKGQPIEVIDNNYAKGVYSSLKSYVKTVGIVNKSIKEFSLYTQ